MSSLFNLPPRNSRKGDSNILKKTNKAIHQAPAGMSIKGGGGLLERIATITAMVNAKLSKYFKLYYVIQDEQTLVNYVDECIKNDIVAIDTETTGLDVLECTMAGICLYTPSNKGVYVPINHVSYITGIKVKDQLDKSIVAREMQRIADSKIDVDMFNAKFDTRVIWHHLDVRIKCTWDGYIAARLLNELEPSNTLKDLHQKYVLKGKGDAWSFNSLFKGIPFTYIPIKVGYVYAARDPHITYELCEFQRPFLTPTNDTCIKRGLTGVANVFHNIEMPLIPTVAKMEDTGINFDFEYSEKLSKKYHAKLVKIEDKFHTTVKLWETEILEYITRNPKTKLKYPLNPNSPQQLSVLFYDIIGLTSQNKKAKRGTGVDAIEGNGDPVCEVLLEYKKIEKLIGTYIDKLPKEVNKKTGRIHANFNQMRTDTGRFSSSDPNMQNIPSKNKDIRKVFIPAPGNLFFSSDYSAQEPRITAHMCRDEKMIQAYLDGKDLYAQVAAIAFDTTYEDCLEFRPDGTRSQEGADRRASAKAIVLGVCYSKGVPAIAGDLGIPVKKAQEIYDTIMLAFPKLKEFMHDSEQMARDFGFVDTVWGRKRRLPDMQLQEYELSYINGVSNNFDPLAFEQEITNELTDAEYDYWVTKLQKTKYWKQKIAIKESAKEANILIKDNSLAIFEATRQCVNSRIQGSAADQTKIAMYLVDNDPYMNEVGFKLLLPVHDELIGEGPEEFKTEIAKKFAELMVSAASELCVPSICDVEVTDRWYGKVIEV